MTARAPSDTYIALFCQFIPVGVWEAMHNIQGLLDQRVAVDERRPAHRAEDDLG